jgi:toxin ParE1/3/4
LIRISKAAAADLRRIDAWLRPRAGTTVTDRVMETILSDIEILDRYPELGRLGREPGTRELVIARLPYVAFYRIIGEEVVIRRVLHGAMQWPRPKRK